jgi:hypothetical protein
MAGRPRTGSIRPIGGRFEASLPNPAGGRHRGYFADRESAGRWVAASLAAMDHGLPVPDYRLYVPTVQTAVAPGVPTGFAEVAWAWWNEQYVARESSPGRRRDVESKLRLHIVPFFTQRVREIQDVTSSDVSAFLKFLAGWGPTEVVSEESPPTMLVARHFSLNEIAALSGALTLDLRHQSDLGPVKIVSVRLHFCGGAVTWYVRGTR